MVEEKAMIQKMCALGQGSRSGGMEREGPQVQTETMPNGCGCNVKRRPEHANSHWEHGLDWEYTADTDWEMGG